MLKKLKVSRRMALRGVVAGTQVAMWLPVLNAMTDENGEAFAQGGALPSTFGIWFWGNGTRPAHWAADGEGQGNAWSLPRNLEAFESVKGKINFFSGLNMLDGDFRGHGAGAPYVLCGGFPVPGQAAPTETRQTKFGEWGFEVNTSTYSAPTIDQVVADHFEQEDGENPSPFKSIETGTLRYTGQNMGTIGQDLSHRGPYDVLPAERDPSMLFDRLFGGNNVAQPVPGERSPSVLANLRRSALDAVQGEVQRLKQQVGQVDAARLDSHLTGIRSIEARLAAMAMDPEEAAAGGGCSAPQDPGQISLTNKNQVTARTEALNRLVVAALGCNLTRVYTHFWSGPRDDNTYPQAGVDAEHHSLTHSNEASLNRASEIERYILPHYADLLEVMDETPMGAGTVLDNTMNWGCTEQGDPRFHRHRDYRLLISGGANGKFKTNQHLPMGARKVTEVQLTMLKTLGLDYDRWGSWDNTNRTVAELLA